MTATNLPSLDATVLLSGSEVRTQRWQAALSIALVLVMLVTFYQVVRIAVLKAETRHKVLATEASEIWRCNAQKGSVVRSACIAQLNARASDAAELQARNGP